MRKANESRQHRFGGLRPSLASSQFRLFWNLIIKKAAA